MKALRLSMTTCPTIAKEVDLPTEMVFKLLNDTNAFGSQQRYMVTDMQTPEGGTIHPWAVVQESFLRRHFEFLAPESATDFVELKNR